MKVAALDLGSNTFLCLISEVNSEGHLIPIKDLAEVVRLGQGVSMNKSFHPDALQRAKLCLSRFSAVIKESKVDKVLAVATAAARTASNQNDLYAIADELEIPLEIISGDQEAELTFQGALSAGFKDDPVVVIDIGGGSTEVISGTPEGLKFRHSYEVGVVRLREQFIANFPIQQDVQEKIQNEISEVLKSVPMLLSTGEVQVIAVAGTPTTLAAAALGGYDSTKVDGYKFTSNDLQVWQSRLMQMRPEEIETKYLVPPGRSDVLLVGVMILQQILRELGVNHLTVSVRGLRFGVARYLGMGRLPS